MALLLAVRRLACVLCGCALVACGDDTERVDAASQDADVDSATEEERRDVYLPGAPDAGDDPLDFTPADPPDAEPAHNPNVPPPDADVPVDAGMPPPRGCIALSAGDVHIVESQLEASRTWRRIEPDACPASLLTDREVAYEVHWVCAGRDAVLLDVAMHGGEPLAQVGAVADPVLVAYADAQTIRTDPFSCLAANDDGMFAEGVGNSARIEQLPVGAGERIAIIATSYERPDQHGIGAYRLEIRAD